MRTKIIALCAVAFIALFNCRRKLPPVAPTPPAWLVTVVQDQAAQNAPGAELVGNIYQGVAYEQGDTTDWSVPLEAGKCYWFSAAGDQGIERLYLSLYDPEDDRVEREKPDSPRVMLAYCPEMAGMHRVEALAKRGRGHFHMGVYAKPAAGAAPAPGTAAKPQPTGAPAAADLGAICDEEAKTAAPGATRVGNHFSGNADETDWYTALEAGKCYWFIGVGGSGINQLWLFLWDPDDKRITANKAETNKVTVGHCPDKAGMYHFQAKIGAGSGDYKVGVYVKDK